MSAVRDTGGLPHLRCRRSLLDYSSLQPSVKRANAYWEYRIDETENRGLFNSPNTCVSVV